MTLRPTEKPDEAPQSAGDIASALHDYTVTLGGQQTRAEARPYRVTEVAWVLGVFALVMGLLDADGLVSWARRMDAGRAQAGWLRVLTPLQTFDSALGLTAPRRALQLSADRLARRLGESEDPLFVEAWRAPSTPPGPAPMPTEPAVAPAAPVIAQAADAPARPTGATVLLVGDSLLAGSLSSAIGRTLATDSRFRVVQALQSATGLSRADVFDWMTVAPALVEREQPRFVVCSFGANDAVAIEQNGALLDFGESEWRAAYRTRVRQMMLTLASKGTAVLWLGLPPMRDKRLNERAAALNRLFAATARGVPGVEYLELNMLVSGADGDFATFGTDASGRFIRMRLDDGVHYSPAGARLVSRWVVDWLRERYRVLGAGPHAPRP